MKSIEAAVILPLVLILLCLTASCCLVAYAHSDKFNQAYLQTTAKTRNTEKLMNYEFRNLNLSGLKAKNLGQREVKCIGSDCRGNEILELIYFISDELKAAKALTA